jgi:hypothetical protein
MSDLGGQRFGFSTTKIINPRQLPAPTRDGDETAIHLAIIMQASDLELTPTRRICQRLSCSVPAQGSSPL